ncbi:hypothetical protein [Actinoallomurus sp. NPDC050550]|uniref:hypothetical protein n=1 Tax=Actinoallomurus sp. NPDC050550 TaxID=3154937 RepID=UPI0033D8C433
MKKLVGLVSAVASLSIATIIGSAGAASANTDSYTYDHVEVGAANNGGSPEVWICSDQSARNSFYFWVHSVGTGSNLTMYNATTHQPIYSDNEVFLEFLNPGECHFYLIQAEYEVQVYAKTGNITIGTDPIPWSQ